jgi:hypothetical protein
MKRNAPVSLFVFGYLFAAAAQAEGRLPDGGTATYASGDVVKAWYSAPTTRYDHGVLGDAIEAGALTVQGKDGAVLSYELDDTLVFEDITPRLADLNGDGNAEIITILSSVKLGAALAVFERSGNNLRLVAKTEFIGKTHRWLNVAGIDDFDGNGTPEIALVKTPHLGGALEFWQLSGSRLTSVASSAGFSNHVIGTRALQMSAIVDANKNGIPEIIVPAADRRSLRHMGFQNGELRELGSFALNGQAVGNLKRISATKVQTQLNNGTSQIISLK